MEVSVIIPIYNSSSYLEECLKSIAEQTFQSWECILVDDGSTDGSGEICDEWSIKDGRFHSIHQQNGGVSRARNEGLKHAKGDYVIFVDSDDYVAREFVETLFFPVREKRYDMVLSGMFYFEKKGEICGTECLTAQNWFFSERVNYLSFLQQPLITSPVAKLYKRSIIVQNGLVFNEKMSLGEDRDFNIGYIGYIQHACSLPYIGYFYRRGVTNSLTAQIHVDTFRDDIIYWDKLHGLLTDIGDDFQSHRLFYFIVDNLWLLLKRKGCIYTWKEWYRIKHLINKQYLLRNMDRIIAPFWQKQLLKMMLW